MFGSLFGFYYDKYCGSACLLCALNSGYAFGLDGDFGSDFLVGFITDSLSDEYEVTRQAIYRDFSVNYAIFDGVSSCVEIANVFRIGFLIGIIDNLGDLDKLDEVADFLIDFMRGL